MKYTISLIGDDPNYLMSLMDLLRVKLKSNSEINRTLSGVELVVDTDLDCIDNSIDELNLSQECDEVTVTEFNQILN